MQLSQYLFKSRYLFFTLAILYFVVPKHFLLFLTLGLIVYCLNFNSKKDSFYASSLLVNVGTLVLFSLIEFGLTAGFVQLIIFFTFLLWANFVVKIKQKATKLILLFLPLLITVGFYFFDLRIAKGISYGFIFLISSTFFTMLIDIQKGVSERFPPNRYHFPPWMTFSLLPVGSTFFYDHHVKTEPELLRSQKSGFSLACKLMVLYSVLLVFFYFCKSNGANFDISLLTNTTFFPDFSGFMTEYLSARLSVPATNIVVIYISGFLTVCKILFLYGFSVVIARLFGLDIPLFLFEWKKVTNLHRFYGNLLFYYNKSLIDSFYIPFYKKVSFLNKSFKKAMTLFLTIFFGGTFAHLIFNLRSLPMLPTFEVFLVKSIGFSVYSFFLGLIVTISVFISDRKLFIVRIPSFIIWIFIFTVYSLIFKMNTVFYRENVFIASFVNNIFKLFGTVR